MNLARNRDFVLLQAGQLLSALGSSSTTIAYPLLVLAVTHSPAQAGVVGFARVLPEPILNLPAGLVADRWDRKRLMIAADCARAVALAALGAAILLDRVALWQIAVVAFVEGTGSVVFAAAQAGALRAVVPPRQLPAAAGAQEARHAVARVGGPPLGGALFGLGRAVPFLGDAVSYGASIVALTAMRTPFQERRERDTASLRAQLAEGFTFLWSRPFLRTCAFLYGLGNFTIPAILFVVVVAGTRQGLSSAEVGLLSAAFAASTLVGALLSPLFRRALAVRTILLLELWLALGSVAFVVHPNVYVLIAALLPQAVVLPVTDSVVKGYGLAVTPDRLLGRVESVRRTIALLVAPLGPLVAGLLLGTTSARTTVAALAACSLALALWGTVSPAIRDAPRLD
ncbi:MAG TPA: MFS transporter [Gaiellaceae bacterium]